MNLAEHRCVQGVRTLAGLRLPQHPPVAPQDDLAVAGLRRQGGLGQGGQEEERHEGEAGIFYFYCTESCIIISTLQGDSYGAQLNWEKNHPENHHENPHELPV